LEWIVRKALAKDCEERYQTARELQIDLKRLKQELVLQAKLEGLAPARRQGRSVATRTDEGPDNLTTGAARTASTAETIAGGRKRRGRNIALGLTALVVAAVAVAVFSLLSFYAGLRRVPPPSHPTSRQLTFRR